MILNGTYYHQDTPEQIARLLEEARLAHKRVRLYYGDTKTGKNWYEEYDVSGYLGLSMGPQKIPIIRSTRHSDGGPGILEHCIVALQVESRWVYRHTNFKVPECSVIHESIPEGYRVGVDIADEKGKLTRRANFKTDQQAARWIAFMRGERQTK